MPQMSFGKNMFAWPAGGSSCCGPSAAENDPPNSPSNAAGETGEAVNTGFPSSSQFESCCAAAEKFADGCWPEGCCWPTGQEEAA